MGVGGCELVRACVRVRACASFGAHSRDCCVAGIGLIEKESKNHIRWKGGSDDDEEEEDEEEAQERAALKATLAQLSVQEAELDRACSEMERHVSELIAKDECRDLAYIRLA